MALNRTLPVVVLTATLLLAPAAQAAEQSSHHRAAADLLQVMQVERTVNDAIDITLRAQLQANPQLGQFEDLLRTFLAKHMAWDALRDDYAQLYVDMFTEAEIQQLLTFYRTAVGQKMIGTLPRIMRRGAELGQSRVSAHLDELTAAVTKRAQELQKAKESP